MLRDGRGKRSLQEKSAGLKDAWKVPQPSPLPSQYAMQQQETSGPPSRTRAGIKRKLQGVTVDFVTSKIKQGKEKARHDNQSAAKEIPSGESSFAKLMPEKHTLELILDVLQRRDTYEIFAEPVDPEKVEDYYEIINEPMDFGTMRAKLHEGMYETLEQFERDVFLIPGNAMHFNSSGTVYFRQARAIDDLAKKVFHVLKTDPENFELEFSGTRRRSGRRPQGEAKDLNFNSSTRLPTNFRHGTVTNDVSSKGKLSLLTGPSISRRKMRGIPGVASTGADVDICFISARDGGRSGSDDADRRSTYTPWMLFHNENEPIFQKFHCDPKSLLLVNDVSYRKSLMLFAKGLGPTAQMVAKGKLQVLSRDAPTQQTDCPIQDAIVQIPVAFASTLSTWETDIMTNRISDQKAVDLLHGKQTVLKPTSEIIDLTDPDDGDKAAHTTKPGAGDMDLNSSTILMNNTERTNSTTMLFVSNDELCTKARQITKHESNSTAPASGSQVSGFNSRNEINNSATSSSWPSQTTIGFSSFSKIGNYNGSRMRLGTKRQATSTPAISDGHRVMMCNPQSSSQESHFSPRFTFDMSFLKSQLNQMRVMGQQDRLLHRTFQGGFRTSTGARARARAGNDNQDQGQATLFDPRGYIKVPVHFAEPSSSPQSTFLHKKPHSGSAAADTDLALQL